MSMANSSASAFSHEIPNNNTNKESCIIDFPFSPALPSCSIFDMPPPPPPSLSQHHDQNDVNASPFAGYIDLLSSDDFTNSWFLNFNFETGTSASPALPAVSQTDLQQQQLPSLPVVVSPAATSEVSTNPATSVSVSSSISESSNETGVVANKPVVAIAVAENEDGVEFVERKEAETEAEDRDGDHRIEVAENQKDQDHTKKPVKPKKKKDQKQKQKQRQSKVVFRTRTEVDHLDDGFRWRKYGQKSVKNSRFPRSYYRCTAHGCDVKKQIERYAPEPSMLLTSYEGKHTHPSPMVARAASLDIRNDAIAAGLQKIHQNQILINGVCGSVPRNQFAMPPSQPQQFTDQTQNVILLQQQQQQAALPPLLYNNDFNNSFNVAPTLNVVNSADNFPPLNAVNSAEKLINSSTSFDEFLQSIQNYDGGNSSMMTNNLMSNDGWTSSGHDHVNGNGRNLGRNWS